jgi:hypothetical protein
MHLPNTTVELAPVMFMVIIFFAAHAIGLDFCQLLILLSHLQLVTQSSSRATNIIQRACLLGAAFSSFEFAGRHRGFYIALKHSLTRLPDGIE